MVKPHSKALKWDPPKRSLHRRPLNKKWTPPKSQSLHPSTFQKKWTLPNGESSDNVAPYDNKLLSMLGSDPGPISFYYYPVYSGWQFPDQPYLFKEPAQAICYGLFKFKQDGLSNMWGADVYPSFARHIGQVSIPPGQASLLSVQSRKVKSSIEKKYFSAVAFHHWSGSLTKDNHNYVNSSDSMFDACCKTMKPTQDYFLSSNSVFRSGTSCPTSSSADVLPGRSNFLDNKLASGGYMQIEKKFKPIKTRSYESHGENDCP